MVTYKNFVRHFIILYFPFILIAGCTVSQDSDPNYKKTVHTFNEAWNTGNYDLLDKVVYPKYVKQEGDEQIEGLDELKEYINLTSTAVALEADRERAVNDKLETGRFGYITPLGKGIDGKRHLRKKSLIWKRKKKSYMLNLTGKWSGS